MPDFFAQLDPAAPMTNFHPAIVGLFDAMLASENVDQPTKDVLARLRAQVDISLKNL